MSEIETEQTPESPTGHDPQSHIERVKNFKEAILSGGSLTGETPQTGDPESPTVEESDSTEVESSDETPNPEESEVEVQGDPDTNTDTVDSEQYRHWKKIHEKEKAQIRRERELKALELNLQKHQQQYNEQVNRAQQLEYAATNDPVQFLLDRGVTYEQIIQRSLNQPTGVSNETDSEYKQRLEKIESEREAERAAKHQQALQQMESTLYREINNAGERWELINGLGAHNLVWQEGVRYAQTYGEDPNWEEVANHVESQLEKQQLPQIKNLLNLKKVRSNLGLGSEEPKPDDDTIEQEAPNEPVRRRTAISNSTASSAPVRESKPITHEERKELLRKKIKSASRRG